MGKKLKQRGFTLIELLVVTPQKFLRNLTGQVAIKKKGFTLIELLVVIAIIGLLASIVLVSLNSARAKARDVKRVSDLNQIAIALELYYDQFGYYPDNTDSGDIGCWASWDAGNSINGASDPFIQPLVTAGIMSKVPIESTSLRDGWNSQCIYRYIKVGTSCSCTNGYAVLFAALETTSNPAGKGDQRPPCFISCWGEGMLDNDYAIYLPH